MEVALHKEQFRQRRRFALEGTVFQQSNQMGEISVPAHASEREVGVERPFFLFDPERYEALLECVVEGVEGSLGVFHPDPYDARVARIGKRAHTAVEDSWGRRFRGEA